MKSNFSLWRPVAVLPVVAIWEVSWTNLVKRQGSFASVCSARLRRLWRCCSENKNGCLQQSRSSTRNVLLRGNCLPIKYGEMFARISTGDLLAAILCTNGLRAFLRLAVLCSMFGKKWQADCVQRNCWITKKDLYMYQAALASVCPLNPIPGLSPNPPNLAKTYGHWGKIPARPGSGL